MIGNDPSPKADPGSALPTIESSGIRLDAHAAVPRIIHNDSFLAPTAGGRLGGYRSSSLRGRAGLVWSVVRGIRSQDARRRQGPVGRRSRMLIGCGGSSRERAPPQRSIVPTRIRPGTCAKPTSASATRNMRSPYESRACGFNRCPIRRPVRTGPRPTVGHASESHEDHGAVDDARRQSRRGRRRMGLCQHSWKPTVSDGSSTLARERRRCCAMRPS